jgi:hypothetical protein
MTQNYRDAAARIRMRDGFCPECGARPDAHTDDNRFWLLPSGCDLTIRGVLDRIQQFNDDLEKTNAEDERAQDSE